MWFGSSSCMTLPRLIVVEDGRNEGGVDTQIHARMISSPEVGEESCLHRVRKPGPLGSGNAEAQGCVPFRLQPPFQAFRSHIFTKRSRDHYRLCYFELLRITSAH